jgi:hypothetical protein
MEKVFEITIFLKNGSQFSIFASQFIVKRNGIGDFAGLEWTNTEKEPRLLYANVDEISAITCKADSPALTSPTAESAGL